MSEIRQAGYVYLIRPLGHNVYKVGCAFDVEQRLRRIQRKTELKLECIARIHYGHCLKAEQSWHRHFAGYRLPGGVEWFALSDSAVEEFQRTGDGEEPL